MRPSNGNRSKMKTTKGIVVCQKHDFAIIGYRFRIANANVQNCNFA